MKKLVYFLSLLLVSLSFAACSDFLNPDNKSAANKTGDDVFSSDPSVLRVYAYSKMKTVMTYTQLFEDGTDLYMVANKKSASDYDQYTFNVEDSNVKGLYSACYSVINMANCCISYDKDGKYTAEMRFLRDYCYYILMQQFGGVPYITSYINSAKKDFPREDLMTEYDEVIADLEAIQNDANLAEENHVGYASKQAVNALLAKVCLAAGWDAERASKDGAAYFQKSVDAAKLVTESYDMEHAMSFEQKWSPTNECNDEVIFAVQYDRAGWTGETKTGGHGLQNTFGSYYGDPTSTGFKYSDSYRAINPKSAYLWESGDQRWDATFMTTVYNCEKGGWGTTGYFAYYNAEQAAKDTMPIAMVYFPGTATSEVSAYKTAHAKQLQKGSCFNEVYVIQMSYPQVSCNGTGEDYVTFVNSGSTSGMYSAPSVKKFDDPSTECIALNKTNDYRDIVLLNMSDIFLTEAEAYLKLGSHDAEALALVNQVRARSGAAAISSFASYNPAWHSLSLYQGYALEPIDVILDERARELFAEGYRWMDLHRTGKLADYNKWFNANLGGKTVKTYRPIPQAEINANSAMSADDQNSEWK